MSNMSEFQTFKNKNSFIENYYLWDTEKNEHVNLNNEKCLLFFSIGSLAEGPVAYEVLTACFTVKIDGHVYKFQFIEPKKIKHDNYTELTFQTNSKITERSKIKIFNDKILIEVINPNGKRPGVDNKFNGYRMHLDIMFDFSNENDKAKLFNLINDFKTIMVRYEKREIDHYDNYY